MTDRFTEIETIIGQPKGQRLEYRAILPPSAVLAELICSFANSDGGFIVLGVADNMEVNGLSPDFHTDPITQKAVSLLTPKPNIFSKNVNVKGKRLFVIAVDKAEETIKYDGKTIIRVGTITKLSDTTKLIFGANGFTYQTKEKSMSKKEQEKGVSYNEYDINLTQSYGELETQLKDIAKSKTGISKEEYLSRIKGGIESYCKYHHLGSLADPLPIILRYPAYNYHAHLAFQLMTFDVNKIWALLDHQHENYLGLDKFQKIVEHGVYNWIKHNSPFDNETRLQKIMEWVEKRKSVEHKNNKLANQIGNKILGKFKAEKLDVGEIVMLPIIQGIYRDSTPPEKKIFNEVFQGMAGDDFISCDEGEPMFIRLSEKGYDRIYDVEDEEITQVEAQGENQNLPTVVILTAIKEEYIAVRSHLDSVKDFIKGSIRYERGVFKNDGKEIANVVIKECGPRNPGTAQETERAITNFRPQCIFFVGIAGSRKHDDFGLGDVIFPENVHYYEGGKSELDGFKSRSNDVQPTHSLVEIAKIERIKPDWKKLIKGDIKKEVNADVGVIASGEQVVEHVDSEVGKILSKHYGDSACVAMEEYGFLSAARRQGVEFATMQAGVVRGVSDLIKTGAEKKEEEGNATERRPKEAKVLASNTAAAFAYWLIVKTLETPSNN